MTASEVVRPTSSRPSIGDIPLVDLGWQHLQIADEVESGWKEVVADSSYILGESVRRFETEFASYVGAEHCIGVGSGTDALELALRALDIGPGDEVIVPTNSFVASALAVLRTGASPVLVDIDPDSFLLSLEKVSDSLTSKTRAVMPVHLYGQMAPLEELVELLHGKDITIVEDAAQAHGARRNGASMGHHSAAAATSFYPGKNLGAYGDGGAVLTNSSEMSERLRRLRNLGSTEKPQHPEVGFNSRLDSLQAVVLSAKLARLEAWNQLRREAADRYHRLLVDSEEVLLPQVLPDNEHAWHLFVVRVPDRDRVLRSLQANGVAASVHYPIPIHRQKPFGEFEHRGGFPVAERMASEILTLPLFPGITEADQGRVATCLREAMR